jgi:thioredoxin-related protein
MSSSYTLSPMAIKTLIFGILLNVYVTKTYAQIQWYSIEQVEQAAKKQRRKAVIQVYTNWSEGFRELQNSVLGQQSIIQCLNNHFVPVKFDAETRQEVHFNNKTYRFITQQGIGFNELAFELLRGQLAYPTLVFLDEDMNFIQAIPYRNAEQFEMTIRYFAEDWHKRMSWNKFQNKWKVEQNTQTTKGNR